MLFALLSHRNSGQIGWRLPVWIGDARSPPILVRHILLPQLPYLARALREQIFFHEALELGNFARALAHDQHVSGVFHYSFGEQGNVSDAPHGTYRPRTARGAVH